MISFKDTVFFYGDSDAPALNRVSLEIPDGAFVLVTGPSGSGKTTLLRAINGLVPHFYGGRFGGRVITYGFDTRDTPVKKLSEVAGMVFQDTTAQFVTDTVSSEIAFGLENSGLPGEEIAARVAEAAASAGLSDLLERTASTLSGGERQKTAIASVLAMNPRALILDEPTAELDPESAHELLDLLARLNREGLTVVLAEHRLERIVEFADTIIEMRQGTAVAGDAAVMLGKIESPPPVVEFGRRMGWQPLPVSVEEAKERLKGQDRENGDYREHRENRENRENREDRETVRLEDVSFGYGEKPVLRDVNLTFRSGEVVAIMGRNGVGKTTLLRLICGLLKPRSGRVVTAGLNMFDARPRDVFARVGYVPQRPSALLFADTLAEEVGGARREAGLPAGTARGKNLLEEFGLADHADDYPRDLSQGEQQRAALADYYFDQGVYYMEAPDSYNAQQAFDSAIRLNPYESEYPNYAGNMFVEVAKATTDADTASSALSVSIDYLEKAIELNPDCPGYNYNLGNAIYFFSMLPDLDKNTAEKYMKDALREYLIAEEADPYNADVHFNLASAYMRFSQKDKAIAELKKGLSLNPNNNQAKQVLLKLEAQDKM